MSDFERQTARGVGVSDAEEPDAPPSVQPQVTPMATTISTSDFERIMVRLGEQIVSGNAARAAEDVAKIEALGRAQTASMAELTRATLRGGKGHSNAHSQSKERVESQSSIHKSQTDAVEFVKSMKFDPDNFALAVWKRDFQQSFSSDYCKEVINKAGHAMYIRQSNDLHDKMMKFEKEYRDRHRTENIPTEGLITQEDPSPYTHDGLRVESTHDRQGFYYDKELILQGPHVTAWRKLLYRQLQGYRYGIVLVKYDLTTLSSCASADGVIYESANWSQALVMLLSFIADEELFSESHFESRDRNYGPPDDGGLTADECKSAANRLSGEHRRLSYQYVDGKQVKFTSREQASKCVPVWNEVPTPTQMELIRRFHLTYPNVPMPVTFEVVYHSTNGNRTRRPTFTDMLEEPMQVPIIPDPSQTQLTIRDGGMVKTGYNFSLRKLISADDDTVLVPITDRQGHVYMAADTKMMSECRDRYPIIAEYDDTDVTGRFESSRAMSRQAWGAYDKAVAELVMIGIEQESINKAQLRSWDDCNKVNTTVCPYSTYEIFRILDDYHYEPDSQWEEELRAFILSIRLYTDVKITYYLAQIEKANTLLTAAGADRMSEALVFEKVKSDIIRVYSEIDKRKADLLTDKYHELVMTYQDRYDDTQPLCAPDEQPAGHKRTVTKAYVRDWKDLSALREACRRIERQCSSCTRHEYRTDYDIEAKRPKNSRTLRKVEALKLLYDADDATYSPGDAMVALVDELCLTYEGRLQGVRTCEHILDELYAVADECPDTPLPAEAMQSLDQCLPMATTMDITRRVSPENRNTLPARSLAGGPGGPRRFANRKPSAGGGAHLTRANQPYLGIHPGNLGKKGVQLPTTSSPTTSAKKSVQDLAAKVVDRRFGGRGRGDGRGRGGRGAGAGGGRSRGTITQQLRRKAEVMDKMLEDAQKHIRDGQKDSALSKLAKIKEINEEIMPLDADARSDASGASGYATGNDSDVDGVEESKGDDSDEEAIQALNSLFPEGISRAEMEHKLSVIHDLSNGVANLTLASLSMPGIMEKYNTLLINAVNEGYTIILQDTCATRGVRNINNKNLVIWESRLKNPIPIAQGASPTQAEGLQIVESIVPVPDTNRAMVKVDLYLAGKDVREGLCVEGMRPTFRRGLAIGPTSNYLFNIELGAEPIRNGKLIRTWQDGTKKFKEFSVPIKELANGLPYVEAIGMDTAQQRGLELYDMYTLKPYDRTNALTDLKATISYHAEEEYFMDALALMGEITAATLTSKSVTFADDKHDNFQDAEEAHDINFEDVIDNINAAAKPIVDAYFTEDFDIYYEAQDERVPPDISRKSLRSRSMGDTRTRASPLKRTYVPPPEVRDNAKGMPDAKTLSKMAVAANMLLTVISLCYGGATESTFQHSSSSPDRLPFIMKAGCEADTACRTRFERLNPHIPKCQSHEDMFTLVEGLEGGTIDKQLWTSNVLVVSTPCYNKTALKDYNRSEYHPDDRLFEYQVRFAACTAPDIILSEMTPPHDLCHYDHIEVARKIRELGYDVTVTDRLPSDLCGDFTHRDRWFMLARKRPIGAVNMQSWADKYSRPAAPILDPIDEVDERLWLDNAGIVPWQADRMGEKKPLRDLTPTDVGQYITHARRVGHLEGHQSEKGTKVVDIDAGPLPCTTRFANDIIIDRRRRKGSQLRLLSMGELARAASFGDEQIAWLRSLDDTGYDGGPRGFQVIAGAIPRNTLHTMFRMCCYEMLKVYEVNASNMVSSDPITDTSVSILSHDVKQERTINLLDVVILSDTQEEQLELLTSKLLDSTRVRMRHTVPTPVRTPIGALFVMHCAQCCNDGGTPILLRQCAYMTDEASMITQLFQEQLLGLEQPTAYRNTTADDDQCSDDEDSDALPVVPLHKTILQQKKKVSPVGRTAWPPFIQDQSSPEYRNAVTRAMKYHQIFHHTADKMEKNIAMGNSHGCQPGDSRYLQPCPVCETTKIDRVRRDHHTKEVSTRADNTLPGEQWLLDGNDTTVYSTWGNYRSCLHFVDSVSYYRISIPVRTANTGEFLDAMRYVRNFTKMTTGRDVKKLYTDQASSFLSDKATDFLAHYGISLEVVPADCHWLNGIAEEAVHNQTREMRCRTPALKGFEVKKVPIAEHTKWWPFADQHAVQCFNDSSYPPLEKRHGHPMSPRQAFFGNHNLAPLKLRAFGEEVFVIIRKDKRESKLHDTAERCRYLFNAGYNPVTNVLADCPRAHVVLRPCGQIAVTAKVIFPRDRHPPHQADPSIVNPQAQAVQDLNEQAETDAEHLRVQRLMSTGSHHQTEYGTRGGLSTQTVQSRHRVPTDRPTQQ